MELNTKIKSVIAMILCVCMILPIVSSTRPARALEPEVEERIVELKQENTALFNEYKNELFLRTYYQNNNSSVKYNALYLNIVNNNISEITYNLNNLADDIEKLSAAGTPIYKAAALYRRNSTQSLGFENWLSYTNDYTLGHDNEWGYSDIDYYSTYEKRFPDSFLFVKSILLEGKSLSTTQQSGISSRVEDRYVKLNNAISGVCALPIEFINITNDISDNTNIKCEIYAAFVLYYARLYYLYNPVLMQYLFEQGLISEETKNEYSTYDVDNETINNLLDNREFQVIETVGDLKSNAYVCDLLETMGYNLETFGDDLKNKLRNINEEYLDMAEKNNPVPFSVFKMYEALRYIPNVETKEADFYSSAGLDTSNTVRSLKYYHNEVRSLSSDYHIVTNVKPFIVWNKEGFNNAMQLSEINAESAWVVPGKFGSGIELTENYIGSERYGALVFEVSNDETITIDLIKKTGVGVSSSYYCVGYNESGVEQKINITSNVVQEDYFGDDYQKTTVTLTIPENAKYLFIQYSGTGILDSYLKNDIPASIANTGTVFYREGGTYIYNTTSDPVYGEILVQNSFDIWSNTNSYTMLDNATPNISTMANYYHDTFNATSYGKSHVVSFLLPKALSSSNVYRYKGFWIDGDIEINESAIPYYSYYGASTSKYSVPYYLQKIYDNFFGYGTTRSIFYGYASGKMMEQYNEVTGNKMYYNSFYEYKDRYYLGYFKEYKYGNTGYTILMRDDTNNTNVNNLLQSPYMITFKNIQGEQSFSYENLPAGTIKLSFDNGLTFSDYNVSQPSGEINFTTNASEILIVYIPSQYIVNTPLENKPYIKTPDNWEKTINLDVSVKALRTHPELNIWPLIDYLPSDGMVLALTHDYYVEVLSRIVEGLSNINKEDLYTYFLCLQVFDYLENSNEKNELSPYFTNKSAFSVSPGWVSSATPIEIILNDYVKQIDNNLIAQILENDYSFEQFLWWKHNKGEISDNQYETITNAFNDFYNLAGWCDNPGTNNYSQKRQILISTIGQSYYNEFVNTNVFDVDYCTHYWEEYDDTSTKVAKIAASCSTLYNNLPEFSEKLAFAFCFTGISDINTANLVGRHEASNIEINMDLSISKNALSATNKEKLEQYEENEAEIERLQNGGALISYVNLSYSYFGTDDAATGANGSYQNREVEEGYALTAADLPLDKWTTPGHTTIEIKGWYYDDVTGLTSSTVGTSHQKANIGDEITEDTVLYPLLEINENTESWYQIIVPLNVTVDDPTGGDVTINGIVLEDTTVKPLNTNNEVLMTSATYPGRQFIATISDSLNQIFTLTLPATDLSQGIETSTATKKIKARFNGPKPLIASSWTGTIEYQLVTD